MKLSFLCPSYNHARYIGLFLDSLVAQTDPEWEAIVVDDASTDGTADIVASRDDVRIRLIRHEFNLGMSAGLNDAFAASTGEIVAFCGTDDVLRPDFVARMKQTFSADDSVGAAYVQLQAIDENGIERGGGLALPQTPRGELFAEMFLKWNVLPSPGMTMRRDVMSAISPLPEGMIMYTDYLMHLEILARHEVALIREPLVKYRTCKSGKAAGISVKSNVTDFREALELDMLMDRACEVASEDVGRFNSLFRPLGLKAERKEDIRYLLGRAALESPSLEKRKWGARTIMETLSVRGNAERIHEKFGVAYSDYLGQTAVVAASDRLPDTCRRLRRRSRVLTAVSGLLLALVAVLAALLVVFARKG